MINKPKINGKSFLNAIEQCQEILHRKTYNTQTREERLIQTILTKQTFKAYLSKKF